MKDDTQKSSSSTSADKKSQEFESAKSAAAEAYEKLMEAKAHFTKATAAAGVELNHEAMEKLHKGEASLEAVGSQLADSVKKNPLTTVGLAFAVGILLAKITSHR